MTIGRAAELKPALLGPLAAGKTPHEALHLDLGGVAEIDSAGVQLLLLARELSAARGKPLRVVACSLPVRQVLRLLHLTGAFDLPPEVTS